MNLLRAIVGHQWLISPDFVSGVLPFVANMVSRGDDTGFESLARPSASYAIVGNGDIFAGPTNRAISEAIAGSIAVIEINGPLMKNDQNCGPVGTATIASWIQQADKNPNIDGIILKIDSPGGTVDGTEHIASVISSTKKKTVAFVDGMACSAGYWIASSANEIIASGQTSMIGSIGTMSSFMDVKPVLEKMGVKFHEINATDSVDKNKVFNDFMKGTEEGYQQYRETILDPLNKVFTGTVSKNRQGKIDTSKENVLTGKVYFAKPALKAGLIDQIGTMDTAIQSIRNSKPKKMSNISAQSYPNLTATLGWAEGFESNEQGVFLQEDHLQSLESELANGSTAAATIAAHEATIAAHQATIQERDTTIGTLNTTNADLQSQLDAANDGMAHHGTTAAAGGDGADAAQPKVKYVDDGSQALIGKYLPKS